MTLKRGTWAVILAGVVLLGATAPALAQEDWDYHYDLSLSAVGIGKEGFILPSYAVGEQKAYTKDSLFASLSTGGGASFQVRRAKWAVGLEVLSVGYDYTSKTGVKVDADQLLAELVTSWRFGSSFELLLGTRYSKLSSDVVYPGTPAPYKRPGDAEWADAFVGGRLVVPAGDRVKFTLRGDVGGFGLASDMVYHAQAKVAFRLADAASLAVGYRYWDWDFENHKGKQKVMYDMTLAGPTLDLVFHF
ncbi:MAG: hypothetical protein KA072_09775 [Thermoanaerobaculaceae bacterium]|nr:hypothetical protein [Thermoanaerobaculaceae bacterium]MDI9622713.1 hypothetical protein [Acidobacteriota bacterium]NLH10034.1 hypothetical protein [Holophagae bacterium]HPW56056.1 hypothetical protein [Thermoanaerobaculaceae bacterium]